MTPAALRDGRLSVTVYDEVTDDAQACLFMGRGSRRIRLPGADLAAGGQEVVSEVLLEDEGGKYAGAASVALWCTWSPV